MDKYNTLDDSSAGLLWIMAMHVVVRILLRNFLLSCNTGLGTPDGMTKLTTLSYITLVMYHDTTLHQTPVHLMGSRSVSMVSLITDTVLLSWELSRLTLESSNP